MAGKKVSVVLKRDKKCKPCVRYTTDGEGAATVANSLYLMNSAVDELENPEEIEVAIKKVK